MDNFQEMFARLNQAQREAVEHVDGPMMVLAGAGTGKTQVLAMRIAHLLRTTGVEPYNILCLTFTEAGVTAMRERLVRILGTAGYYIKVHTFHSFCNDVILEHPERFMFAREMAALTDLERVKVLQELLDKRAVTDALRTHGSPYYYLDAIGASLSQLKREHVDVERLSGMVKSEELFLEQSSEAIESFLALNARDIHAQDVDDLVSFFGKQGVGTDAGVGFLYRLAAMNMVQALAEAQANPTKQGKTSYAGVKAALKKFYESLQTHLPKQISLIELYQGYQESLKAKGRYDFDDMILFVLKAFENDPTLRAAYQERFQYILIDEYQDTNASQNRLARYFGEGVDQPNIFVVGDDDQAIYRFQGANLENVVDFYTYYSPEVKVVTLTDNYRSHQHILDVSGRVIANNVYRAQLHIPEIIKELQAKGVIESKPLSLLIFDTAHDELYWIAKDIERRISEGTAAQEIAVLFRNNAQGESIARVMSEVGVPYALESGENVFEVPCVRQFINLLKVIENPYDNYLMFSLLHYQFLKIEIKDVLSVHQYHLTKRKENGERYSYFEIMLSEILMKEAGVEGAEDVLKLAKQIEEWRRLVFNESIMTSVETVFEDSGLLKYCDCEPNSLQLLSAFKTLFEHFRVYCKESRDCDLAELLRFIDDHMTHEISIPYYVSAVREHAVRLMTVHRSKGLEFGYVYLPQLTDSFWGDGGSREKIKLPPQILTQDVSALAKQSIEDERRLFYVALTRGKDDVIMSYAKHRDDGKEQFPSQFTVEVGDQLIEILDTSAYHAPAMTVMRSRVDSAAALQKEILQGRLDQLRLSPTNLNDYLHCPRLFYYRHFIKAPIMRGRQLALGTAAHEAVEWLYRSYQGLGIRDQGDEGEAVSKAGMLVVFEKALNREVLDEKDFRESLDQGKDFLGKYYDYYHTQLVRPLEIELDFTSHHVMLEQIPLTGKVDMIELCDPIARQVALYDFKTGNPENKSGELKVGEGGIWRQIVFYKLLTQLSGRFKSKYVMVKGVVDFLQPKKDGSFWRKEIVVGEEECELVKEQIRDVWRRIHLLEFACCDEKGVCEYCERVLWDGVE